MGEPKIGSSPAVAQPIAKPIGERRMVFRDLDWQQYQLMRRAIGEHRAVRFTFDQGLLEITMPLATHEFASRMIALFIHVLVDETDVNLRAVGSTTLNRERLNCSVEPDEAYYIQNHDGVAERTLNLDHTPPPDLVVEVDLTPTHIDKLRLYASLGIPEFWRYDGKTLHIYYLQSSSYSEVTTSSIFPQVPKSRLYEFLAQAQQNEVDAELALRAWVRSLP